VTSENRVGEVLASKYRLEELLGSGGMGHVYRAVNQDVGRTVAIKVLRAEHAQNPQVAERFLREARAANLVRHPNVVDVIDIGREASGAPFIVQELLVGEDLAHLVERRGGKLSVEEAVDLLGPVIDAVAEAHARGVIHRDLKPENVFLAKGARGSIPKLLDFGISKVSAPDLRATEVGVVMGTPAYMPPEQVQGARDADPRSDVWALGVMLFEILAGRLPFDAHDPAALFIAIATKDAPALLEVRAGVSPEISRVVARCLRRRPDERYPSATELARDLRHVVDGTDLEPTGRHSIPPISLHVPDLMTPAAPIKSAPLPAPVAPIAIVVNVASDDLATEPGPPEAAPAPTPPPPVPPPSSSGDLGQMHAAPPLRPPLSPEARASRLAADAALSGVSLAPGGSQVSRGASHAAWGLGGSSSGPTDVASLIGAAVIGVIVIFGVGLLMQVAHRPEGWAVARFVLQPGQTTEVVLHGFLALLAFGIGATYCWRGVRHWRGDLGAGPPNAILNAVVAAGAFFCAIELVCAVT
jgi:eukaryotic-like serine/threonine-protein kinase